MKHFSLFHAFCACSVLTVLAGCSASSGVPDKGKLIDTVPKVLTYQTAPTLEQALSPENTRASIINDPAVAVYPQQIVDKLLSVWDGTKPPSVTVYLTPSTEFAAEDTSQFDALFLSAGTIRYVKDHLADQPEALVFGLAHELAHVLLRHSAAARSAKEKKNYLFVAEKWASIGMAMAGGGDAGSMLLGGMGGKAFIDSVIFSDWTRAQEETADALAVDLMARAGYDLGGATALLDALAKQEERIEADNKAQLAKSGQSEFKSDSVHLAAKSNDALGGLLIDTLNILQKSHPDAKYRKERITNYINNNYGRYNASQSIDDSFARWSQGRSVSIFLNDAKVLDEAGKDWRTNNDWHATQKDLARLSPIGRNNVTAIYFSALADGYTGKLNSALDKLGKIFTRHDVTVAIVEDAGRVLGSGFHRYDLAERYLAAEGKAFDTHDFLPYRIKNGLASGDSALTTKANELSVQCEAIGDDELEKQCLADAQTKPDNKQQK